MNKPIDYTGKSKNREDVIKLLYRVLRLSGNYFTAIVNCEGVKGTEMGVNMEELLWCINELLAGEAK